MKCMWQAYITLLPHWMRQEVDRLGKDDLLELHMRIGKQPQLLFPKCEHRLSGIVSENDISFVINAASDYSPWTTGTVSKGFLTADGGHRIGICGVGTINGNNMTGISKPTSLCIRVARDFAGIARGLELRQGSILLIGPPGSGKTTLLRDLIRLKSNLGRGSVCVVDERQELFPMYKGQPCFEPGDSTDILSGCSKTNGIEAVLRSMNPRWIAVDEITAESDCEALLHAGWCGVELLATAHAGSLQDLRTRPVYKTLIKYNLFSTVVVLRTDKSWTMERM